MGHLTALTCFAFGTIIVASCTANPVPLEAAEEDDGMSLIKLRRVTREMPAPGEMLETARQMTTAAKESARSNMRQSAENFSQAMKRMKEIRDNVKGKLGSAASSLPNMATMPTMPAMPTLPSSLANMAANS